MNAHAFYLWSSYGALAVAVIAELWFVRRRRVQAFAMLRRSGGRPRDLGERSRDLSGYS